MIYRVNYGNGQVGPAGSSMDMAHRIADMERATNRGAYAPFIFVQKYEAGSADAPGDWFRVKELLP